MHSQLLHDNIIRLYCAWKDSQFIHVAEEYAPHGDIYTWLKRHGPTGVSESVVVTKVPPPAPTPAAPRPPIARWAVTNANPVSCLWQLSHGRYCARGMRLPLERQLAPPIMRAQVSRCGWHCGCPVR